MSLRVIDIASWQEGIDPAAVDCDAVIVKVCGGSWYENPFWREWADRTLESGKLLGLYHYAREGDADPDAEAEARRFLSLTEGYRGLFIPILDWENEALELPVSWAKTWLDMVAAGTGAEPWFYGYASNVNSTDYSPIADYPLWMASYLDRYVDAGWESDPINVWDFGAWPGMVAYQYTSTGHVEGYDRELDLSVFYGTTEDWMHMCGNGPARPVPVYDNVLSIPDAAAEIMWHKVNHDQHGYSQPNRSTNYDDKETITLSDGTQVDIAAWDDDCSAGVRDTYLSLGIDVGCFTYTGNEAEGLLESGNFVRVGLDDVTNGDILLREGHTEMVVVRDGTMYQAGFRHGDYPGGLDGETGDQDGTEATYSEYLPWTWEEAFHCTATRPGEHVGTPTQTEDDMYCIFQPDGKGYLCYFDGQEIHPLSHPDEAEALQMVYMATHNGQRMPVFQLGSEDSPWAARLADVLKRKGLLD